MLVGQGYGKVLENILLGEHQSVGVVSNAQVVAFLQYAKTSQTMLTTRVQQQTISMNGPP